MERERIEDELLGEIAARAQKPFTPQTGVLLFRFLRNGVREMVKEGRTERSDLASAKENLRRFLEEMENARATKGVSEYREDIFAAARKRLCPGLWPFC